MTLERGYLLNQRYRIVEILGQGGMASVYRAIDENLGVEVALKENLFTTDEYARQFRREAVILANLRHPNLPRVTDHFVIEQQGQYLVMDYIEGEDLRQRMERIGSLPEQEVVIIGVALCDELTYLHSRSPQVLHRALKRVDPQSASKICEMDGERIIRAYEIFITSGQPMSCWQQQRLLSFPPAVRCRGGDLWRRWISSTSSATWACGMKSQALRHSSTGGAPTPRRSIRCRVRARIFTFTFLSGV